MSWTQAAVLEDPVPGKVAAGATAADRLGSAEVGMASTASNAQIEATTVIGARQPVRRRERAISDMSMPPFLGGAG